MPSYQHNIPPLLRFSPIDRGREALRGRVRGSLPAGPARSAAGQQRRCGRSGAALRARGSLAVTRGAARFTTPLEKKLRASRRRRQREADALTAALFRPAPLRTSPRPPAASSPPLRAPRPRSLGTKGHPLRLPAAAGLRAGSGVPYLSRV